MLLAQAILVALKSYGFGATTFLGEACIKIVPTSQNHAYSEDKSRQDSSLFFATSSKTSVLFNNFSENLEKLSEIFL